jgi:GNAT superfamily N-acetyltransferase
MLTIRQATRRDAAALMQVHREAVFAKARDYYPRAALESWAPGTTADRVAQVEREIGDPRFIVLVAEAAGEIIGFAMAVPSKGELRAVYAKPNLVGLVGRALLAEIEKRAFATTEVLWCDASLNAEGFYKANGYREECRTSHVFASGAAIGCLRMTKLRSAGDPYSE